MVFPALSNIYQLYKQDTDAIATWLASTAKSLGFYAGSSSAATSSTPTAEAGEGSRYERKTHVVKIKDFVPLAEYVAEKATPVPDTFRATINRVIAARSGFGSRLSEHVEAVSDLDLSDAKHEQFIGGEKSSSVGSMIMSLVHLTIAPSLISFMVLLPATNRILLQCWRERVRC